MKTNEYYLRKDDYVYERIKHAKEYRQRVIRLRTGAEMVVRDNINISRQRQEEFERQLNDCNDYDAVEIAERIAEIEKTGQSAGFLHTQLKLAIGNMMHSTRKFLYGQYLADKE